MTKILFRLCLTALCAITASAMVQAADMTPAKKIGSIEGVYKKRFMNGAINPGAPDTIYESEDIVEIVRYDDSHIYFRAELQFYNGHSCSVAGIAAYVDGGFLYKEANPLVPDEPACTLKISATGKSLLLTDRQTPDGEASCRAYCGMRGSLSDYAIAMSSKRKIRYLDLVLKSRQYQAAVSEFQRK